MTAEPITPEAGLVTASPVARSRSRRVLRRFLHNEPLALAGLVVIVLMIGVGLFGPIIVGYGSEQDLGNVLADPFSGSGILGTDELGRDVWARLIASTRVAVLAGLLAVGVAVGVGVPIGLVSGYAGGRTDSALSRIVDGVIAIPPLILAIAIVGLLGRGLVNAMVAVGLVLAPTFARLTRSSTRAVKSEAYVTAARAIGVPGPTIVVRHVIPNVVGPIIVQASLSMGVAVIAEASLSFLGLGVQAPQSSWGLMMARAFQHLERQPWLIVWPGLCITLYALAFTVLGDGLRDALGRED